ncbi:MAG: MIP/aquaporin family protein [Gemmatimonadota bacterium]
MPLERLVRAERGREDRRSGTDEVNGDQLRRALAEGLGAFFLVFVGTGTVAADAVSGGAIGPVGIAFAFGAVIAAMIYAVGHISGAHFNPAVTLALWSAGHVPTRTVPTYVAAQCLGAIAGSAAVRVAFGPGVPLGVTTVAASLPAAFVVEALLSFALLFVIIAVATDRRVAGGVAGVAVGLVVAFGSLVGGTLTGASMNPARSLGPALVAGQWGGHWLYWAAPIAGMLVAARFYEAVRPANSPTAPPVASA